MLNKPGLEAMRKDQRLADFICAGPSTRHEESQNIIQTLTAILWCALKSQNPDSQALFFP
jgi:hypothetical protein